MKYAFEFEDSIIVVDCGLAFPEDDMLGIDLCIPDVTYLKENINKVKGFVITHGHEDHIGAVPYLLQNFDIPVYSSKLVQGFLNERLNDRSFKGLAQKLRFNLITPDTDEVNLGYFKVKAVLSLRSDK